MYLSDQVDNQSSASLNSKMNRRKALSTLGKAAIGIVGVVIIGGVAYYVYSSGQTVPVSSTTSSATTTTPTTTSSTSSATSVSSTISSATSSSATSSATSTSASSSATSTVSGTTVGGGGSGPPLYFVD